MAKYLLTNDDNVDPLLQVPDMRGMPKSAVRAGVDHLAQVYGLPDAVAARALLRTVPVDLQWDGSVIVDDDTVVLRPSRDHAIRILREAVPRRTVDVEYGG